MNRSVIPADMIFPFLTYWTKGTLADTKPPRLFPHLPRVAARRPGPEGREYLPGLAAAGLLRGMDVSRRLRSGPLVPLPARLDR